MVVVPVKLGSGVAIDAILDTGAGLAVLAPSVIEKVHGTSAGQFTGFRMTGERLDIPLFVIPELTIGSVQQKDVLVGSWDVLDKMHLDGIVSLRQFSEQPFTLDFVNKQLTVETPASLAKRKAEGSLSPLQLDEQRGITIDMFARFLIAGQPVQCEIDSGSPSATVNVSYMQAMNVDKEAKTVHKSVRHSIGGGEVVRYDTTVPEISLAAAPKLKLDAARVSFGDIIYDCVVGVDFWSDKVLTIDLPGRQIVVSQPAAKP